MNALIIDDEPLVRSHLKKMLEAQSIEVVGDSSTATEGIALAEDLSPDIVFLDIQMPGMTGLQMAAALRSLDKAPFIVFVSAYGEYAVAAFEFNTLDYLLKPVSVERLALTLIRARSRIAEISMREPEIGAELQQQTAQDDVAVSEQLTTLARLPIREGYAVRLLRLEEILCAIARDKRVYVRTAAGEYKTYYSLKQLERLLPADRFLRIHDSYIVQIELVRELHNLGSNSYSVRLSDGYITPVSRSRYRELQIRVGITPAV